MGKFPLPFFVCTLAGMALSLFSATFVYATDGETTPPKQAWVEPNVDRPGSDFKILWLKGGLQACQEACAQNPQCKSYTYVRTGVEGRLEGCWMKNGVPPPVEDGCCVSGVKSEETVSRFVREPVLPPRVPDMSPDGAIQEETVPKPPPVETEERKEEVPSTGAGKRVVEKMDFDAVLPERVVPEKHEVPVKVPVAVPPPVPVLGTGRKEAKGIDFSASEPATATRTEVPAAASRNGRRDILGVTFAASPVRKAVADRRREGSAIRNVTGVDIKAAPARR